MQNEQTEQDIVKQVREEKEELLKEIENMNVTVKPMEQKQLREKMITVYGDIKLDNQEKQYLSLGPEFTVLEKLDRRKIKSEFQSALTKIRWSRMGKETSEVRREVEEKELEEEEQIEKQVHLNQRVYEEENNQVWLSRKRCTEIKTNRRVIFPTGRSPREESELEVRKQQ